MIRRGLGIAVLALAASCAPPSLEPRPVQPESDVCPECRMTVVPNGYAAESVSLDGSVQVFDDPGCLVLHLHDNPGHFQGAALWVQSADTKDWVAFDKAVFVRDDGTPTPMNYGWHAFATAEGAQSFVGAHPTARVVGVQTPFQLFTDLGPRRWKP